MWLTHFLFAFWNNLVTLYNKGGGGGGIDSHMNCDQSKIDFIVNIMKIITWCCRNKTARNIGGIKLINCDLFSATATVWKNIILIIDLLYYG